jgi:general L-amino acid transport system substrate-binding protein
VLGDTDAVEFVNLTGTTRFEALADGEIDVLSRNTTWTFSRDVELGFTFSGISYYDGQGFMVPASRDISSATELGGATICVTTDTTTELNLADFFDANGIEFEKRSIPTNAEALEQYVDGACDAFTSDASGLAAARATLDDPGAHVILPEIISKEPLGPVVRQDDPDWADLVRWVLNAMIAAEEYGVTSENVGRQARSAVNPEVQRLLGAEGNQGEMLGLDPDWAVRIIRDVGNYGEVFEDTIGANSEIDLARGLNAQWTDGGLLYAPPFR